jgi:hypothetical protein
LRATIVAARILDTFIIPKHCRNFVFLTLYKYYIIFFIKNQLGFFGG